MYSNIKVLSDKIRLVECSFPNEKRVRKAVMFTYNGEERFCGFTHYDTIDELTDDGYERLINAHFENVSTPSWVTDIVENKEVKSRKMKRIVLVNCIDADEFEKSVKNELPMILENSEFKMDDMDVCMFVDDNPKIVDAAEKFLKKNNVRYVIG